MPLATHEADAMVAFVGAGPGDPELLTLKAQRLIAKADVLIYADSLVSPDVCQYAKPGAAIYGSATLTLEAIIDIMLKAVAHGQFVVRLQSGDPGLYGAIYEQQRLLDRHGIGYIIVPGVSSVFAAAAAVGAELTVPEVAQSLILTRQAGRVPMPERESLRSLASHTTTLCIFLSITRVRQVVEELLAGGYTPQTPAVVVYRATWPDQKIIRSTLTTLVQDVKQARISRQALIMVGWAFAPAQGDDTELKHRSHLYLPEYKHLFRGGIAPDEDASGIGAEQAERHGDRKGSGLPAALRATASHPHGDRKGPPNPTQPPSPLLYTGLAAPASYSSGEGGAMGMGGPLRSPCGCAEQADHTATKRIALVVLTRAGLALALRLQPDLGADVHIYASPRAWKTLDAIADKTEVLPQIRGSGRPQGATLAPALEHRSITRFETVAPLLSQLWTTYDQIVLFLALGAVVRLIAPLLRHKHVDPGIVAIDDAGRFAISVISGHIGDANGLAMRCAALLGAIPVVTTASDVHNTLAADMLAHTREWQVEDSSAMTAVSAAIVNGEAVAVLQDCGELDWWGNERPWPGNLIHVTIHQEVSATHFAALLVIADRLIEGLPRDVPTLVYRPPTLVLGIGCRRGVSFSTLDTFVKETLAEQHVAFQSITLLATADIKADEAALQLLAQRYGWGFETHAVTALKTVTEVPNPSERVQRLVGTPSVCEAAALLSSNGGELIVPKQKGEGITIAVARKRILTDASGIGAEQAERHGDRKGSGLPAALMATASHPHGDRKGPPNPTQPPSPLLYTGLAAPASYSSGEGGAMGMGGPLRSPCLGAMGPGGPLRSPCWSSMEQAAHSGHLAIIGLGPGSRDLVAPRAIQMLEVCDTVIGYRVYIEQIRDLLADKDVHVSELTHEVERATLAVQQARNGRRVCIVSSGDAGIYGMAGLVLDLLSSDRRDKSHRYEPLVEVIPGISALNAAAALLGAPLMHDFAVISLSDLLTPWDTIARRLSAAAAADFVIVLYNPISRKRHWQLGEARHLLLASRSATTPVGVVRNAYRPEQQVWLTTLEHLLDYETDMFTTIVIGNSCTRVQQGRMITPRGYENKGTLIDE